MTGETTRLTVRDVIDAGDDSAVTPNIIQQLRADYEASTQGEWEVFARQGLNPGEEEWFLGYEITGPEQPSRGQFVRRADAALCVAAHNHMPLLLEIAEAVTAIGIDGFDEIGELIACQLRQGDPIMLALRNLAVASGRLEGEITLGGAVQPTMRR